jgi:hypothetical protein
MKEIAMKLSLSVQWKLIQTKPRLTLDKQIFLHLSKKFKHFIEPECLLAYIKVNLFSPYTAQHK